MLRSIWAIAAKDIYLTFTDRSLLVIMLLTPLALSLIIGLAFGGFGGSSGGGFSDIPIAIVNLDEGTGADDTAQNLGETFVDVFLPTGSADTTDDSATCELVDEAENDEANGTSLEELFTTTVLDDVDIARAGVDDGTYVAAIIVPDDFSEQLVPAQAGFQMLEMGQTSVEIYSTDGSPLSASIARSVVEGIVNQFATGNVTITSTINAMIERAGDNQAFALQFIVANVTQSFEPDFSCAFLADVGSLSITQQPLNVTQEASDFVQLLVFTGAAQAVFFALFTAQFGLLDIYNERKQGTLQRLMVAPISRAAILAGKLLGTFVTVVIQLWVLMLALTAVASLIEGEPVFIWGSNIPLLLVLVLVVALSVSGIGILIVSIAQTEEQTRVIGPVLNAGFAALGGAFGFALPREIAQLSPIFWGQDAFTQIAAGNPDVGLNLVVLLLQGGLMFIVGVWLFNRRKGL